MYQFAHSLVDEAERMRKQYSFYGRICELFVEIEYRNQSILNRE